MILFTALTRRVKERINRSIKKRDRQVPFFYYSEGCFLILGSGFYFSSSKENFVNLMFSCLVQSSYNTPTVPSLSICAEEYTNSPSVIVSDFGKVLPSSRESLATPFSRFSVEAAFTVSIAYFPSYSQAIAVIWQTQCGRSLQNSGSVHVAPPSVERDTYMRRLG